MKKPIDRASAVAAVAFAMGIAGCGGGSSNDQSTAVPPPTANAAPTISGLSATQTVAQDAISEPIVFSVSDAESAASAVDVSAESSNLELLPVEGMELSGNDTSRTLVLVPAAGVSGAATIMLTATDAAGMSTRQSFNVDVTSQQRSFKEMVGTAFSKGAETDGEQIVGSAWVDNPEDDEAAFDQLFAK